MDDTVDARRARLSNMKSFFGGKACTREACAIRSLKPEAPSAAPSKAPAVQRKAAGTNTAGSNTATKGTQPRRAAPSAQKQRRSHYADFSELDDDTPGTSSPSNRIPTAGERALAAVEAMERMRQQKSGARPQAVPSPQTAQYGGGPPAAATSAGNGRPSSRPVAAAQKTKVVHSRSKFGAGARGDALPPQERMKGLTERQKADRVMQRMHASSISRQKASQTSSSTISKQDRPSHLPSIGVQRPLPSNGRPGSAAGQLPRLKRGREPELGDDYDSNFVASDDDVGEDWHTALRSLTGYDPRKFNPADDRDDRRMVASKREIEAEERRSKRLGVEEDRAEEAREAQRASLKAARKEKAGRAKKGAAAFLDD